MLGSYILLIFYTLHINNLTYSSGKTLTKEECSCTMFRGCNFSTLCHRNNDKCNIVNVALGKPTKMSTVYINEQEKANSSYRKILGCLAVDGFTNSNPVTNFSTTELPSCIHTDYSDMKPSWTVDLKQKYTVLAITVIARTGYENRLLNTIITVDNNHCYEFKIGTTISIENNIKCDKQLSGTKVQLYKKSRQPGSPSQDYVINVCEVQVWACSHGFYGQNCQDTCNPDGCRRGCESANDTCERGCSDGYYGIGCTEKCGHCIGGERCPNNGECPFGCKMGYFGKMCQDRCYTCVADRCDITGRCDHGCRDGWTNENCTEVHRTEDDTPSDESGESSFFIIFLVVGVFVVLLVAGLLLLSYMKKKSRKRTKRLRRLHGSSRTSRSQRTRLTSASRHSAPDFITNDQKWGNVDPIPEHEFLQNSFLERKDSNNLDPKDKVSESSVQESSWSENVVLDDGDTEYKDYLPSDQREEEGIYELENKELPNTPKVSDIPGQDNEEQLNIQKVSDIPGRVNEEQLSIQKDKTELDDEEALNTQEERKRRK